MDSSLVDVDVQSNYVRVTLKGKILQLCLQESVKSELSSAQRSQTTGQLLIKMPKVYKIFQKLLTYIQITQLFQQNPVIREFVKQNNSKTTVNEVKEKKTVYLEVDDSKKVDFKNIINNKGKTQSQQKPLIKNKEKENSSNFVDDPDVPPLM